MWRLGNSNEEDNRNYEQELRDYKNLAKDREAELRREKADLVAEYQREIADLKAKHARELEIKEFEMTHYSDREVRAAEKKVAAMEKQVAVIEKELEMVRAMLDINADIVDVKDIVEGLMKKLPEIKLESLSVINNGSNK